MGNEMKKRPYIICHMISSIDGRIDCSMTEQIESGDEYYEALGQLQCPSLIMGRVTMELHYASAGRFIADSVVCLPSDRWHVARRAHGYTIGIDTSVKLQWPANEFDGPLLVITSRTVSAGYHERLTEQGISWIAAGYESVDLRRAMEILHAVFKVERLALTGGGHINGAFLEEGLIDEVSVMIAPGVDGRQGMATIFDGIRRCDGMPARRLRLKSMSDIGDGTVWLRYYIME